MNKNTLALLLLAVPLGATMVITTLSSIHAPGRSAVELARQHLAAQPFSRQSLIDQLALQRNPQFSTQEILKAVDSLHVDWNQEAARAAKGYLHKTNYSCQQMKQKLVSSTGDKFTQAQADYAATKMGLCPAGTAQAHG